MKTLLLILCLLDPQDAKKWAEASAYFQKFSTSKDPADRAAAAKALGEATIEKTDKICWQLLSGHLKQELAREGDGRNEDKVSGLVLDACVDALKRIAGKDAVDQMTKAAKAKGDSPRYRAYMTWALAAHGDLKDLADLADDKAPWVQIAALDALAERAEKVSVDLFLKVIRDEKRGWEAKLAALKGIDKAADEKVVDALIEALGKVKLDEGRLKDEYLKILKKLVGAEMNTDDVNAWKAAWTAKKDGKDFLNPAEGDTTSEPIEFFGLKTKSTRIVFILDRTGSMASPLKMDPPKPAPKDPAKKPEVASGGGKKESPEVAAARDEATKLKKKYDERKVETRMDALKKEFINTLWNLNEKIWFGVVFYEGNNQPWKDHLVPATWANKLEIMRETDKLQPSGPTNIWGALEHAYRYVEQPQRPDIMQVDKKGNYATLVAGADTFFLMTDGAHNIGKFVNEKATSPLDVCDVPAFAAEIRKIHRIRKVVINTICLGSDAKDPGLLPDPKLMQKIAEETGGEFTQIKG